MSVHRSEGKKEQESRGSCLKCVHYCEFRLMLNFFIIKSSYIQNLGELQNVYKVDFRVTLFYMHISSCIIIN